MTSSVCQAIAGVQPAIPFSGDKRHQRNPVEIQLREDRRREAERQRQHERLLNEARRDYEAEKLRLRQGLADGRESAEIEALRSRVGLYARRVADI